MQTLQKCQKGRPARDGNREAAIATIRQAANKWPSPFVARSEISRFSGGLVAPGTAANHDSAGTGIAGAFRVGRQVAYPVDSAIEWLIAKLED